MAKHLDKFTKAFQQSRIPFLLAEVITDGHGDMVDLVCRFANSAAGALLEIPAEELAGQRFTRRFPAQRLAALSPLQDVAFGGSAASFPYASVLGRTLDITCYQVMYGIVGCILEPQADTGRTPGELLAESLPGAVAVLEMSRAGLRCLSFNRRLCSLSGWSRKDLLDHYAQDFSRLIDPRDWPDLLQDLLDAIREERPVAHELRLLQKDGSPLWVDLRAELLSSKDGVTTLYAVLLDIDQRRRTQSRLRETLGQLTTAQDQLASLFDNLPGRYCLYQIEADGSPVPLRVSQGLADLLGCPQPELLSRLLSDPLWPVAADDRSSLSAAVEQAWNAGQACFSHTCRLRGPTGPVWAFLEGVRQLQDGGASLLYITCSDHSHERAMEADLAFHVQLRELLLDHTATILFDYDPIQDAAHIESPDQSGRRTRRTVSSYLTFLSRSGVIHPDDQKRLISSIKQAATRPIIEQTEFRGNYDGSGWRWYRISWLRSIDGKGNVIRLLGKAVDISCQKAAAQRFQKLTARQKKLAPGMLAAACLDLTADRILDAKGATRHLARVLFGNTADACLRHLRDNIPDEAPRQQFDALFRRDTLLDAFRQGELHFSLLHPFSSGSGTVWVQTALALASSPEDGHLTAFCTVRNTGLAPPLPSLTGSDGTPPL